MTNFLRAASFFLFLVLFSVAALGQSESGNVLVRYTFDDENISTGPDTFTAYNHAKGRVTLATDYQFSGFRSVKVRDVAGDGTFPELQGYFPVQRKGKLFAHFAMMVTNPEEAFNIALAGPAWFTVRKDGIGFWLSSENGVLRHHTNGRPQDLFKIKAFTWYTVDVTYDFEAGAYDLIVFEEGQTKQPITALAAQKNCPNKAGSAVDKFSFIGDLEDRSNVAYYIDDVTISIDKPVEQVSFVAPGRKKLFVDRWNDYARHMRQKPTWIPAVDFKDFGIDAGRLATLKGEGTFKVLEQVVAGQSVSVETREKAAPETVRLLSAVESWNEGCRALEQGKAKLALERFDKAAETVPEGKIYRLSSVLALGALKRWSDVDERLVSIYADWQKDLRLSVALAMLGAARGEFESAERILQTPAKALAEDPKNAVLRKLWGAEISPNVLAELKSEFAETWRERLSERLVCEQYYFVQLWNGKFPEAERFAVRMAERTGDLKLPVWKWRELAGDAAFLSGNPGGALIHYEASLKEADGCSCVMLKLSDVYFRLGDLEKERSYRERIYGGLNRED